MGAGSPLHSYGKVWALGHRSVAGIFDRPVLVQEKVDGSQISFGIRDGELHARSKGAPIDPLSAGMFQAAWDSLYDRAPGMHVGYTYRGEYLRKPKHNTLGYDRVPEGHIAIFDVQDAAGEFFGPEAVAALARSIGLETVRTLDDHANIGTAEELRSWLRETSALGGTLIEGVVVKRYDALTPFGDPYFGKYVSEAFKETHTKSWKERNPGRVDVLAGIQDRYRNPARWDKAVQHLRDAGTLEQDPRDIGALMREVKRDVLEECKDEIKDALFEAFWKSDIERGLTAGLPEWYKDRLLEGAFA